MIAASLMLNQRERIAFSKIKTITKNMYEHLIARDIHTFCSAGPENYDIYHSIRNLGFKIEGNALDKKKGNMAIAIAP